MHQYQITQALEKAQMQTICLAMDDVVWVEEGIELLIDGAYFDVKQFKINGAIFEAEGLFDEVEKDIKLRAKKLAEQQDSQPNAFLQFMFHFSAVLPQNIITNQLPNHWKDAIVHHTSYKKQLALGTAQKLLQPPNFS